MAIQEITIIFISRNGQKFFKKFNVSLFAAERNKSQLEVFAEIFLTDYQLHNLFAKKVGNFKSVDVVKLTTVCIL